MVKNPPANTGDTGHAGSTPGLCGGGHGNPLQCSCLENLRQRSLWAAVRGVAELDTTQHRARANARAHPPHGFQFPYSFDSWDQLLDKPLRPAFGEARLRSGSTVRRQKFNLVHERRYIALPVSL